MQLSTSLPIAFALLLSSGLARGSEPPNDIDEVLGEHAKRRGFVVERVETAMTGYQQDGLGYQSKQGPTLGRGSQRLTVFQPQLLVVARQHERITHRLWFPVDIVTAASANAIDIARKPPDMMSQASRVNQTISFDWLTTYTAPRVFAMSARNMVHTEEHFRSWGAGVGATVSLAEDNSTISTSAYQILDWFTRFDILGHKLGRTSRSTTNGNVGFTQILTPTTIAHVNYGLSAQYGEMGNTWNSVPTLTTAVTSAGARTTIAARVLEQLPRQRIRHALVGRVAQYLPWDGAVKGFYRFYADDWGLVAHAFEGQLLQRLIPSLYVRGSYRYYTQSSVSFFTSLTRGDDAFYTADSDLGRFDTHTLGGKATIDVPLFEGGHLDIGYERYWRTDGLTVNVALWQAGARF